MFALVKKLFGKSEPAPSRTASAGYRATTPFPPKPAAGRATTPAVPPSAAPPARKAEISKPAPETAATAPPRKPAPLIPESEYSKETVDLPLKQLWSKLNPEVVQTAVFQPKGDTFLKIPLNLVQAHLARGGLKIPFAQFRQFSPEGLFNGHAPAETLEINIPIGDVLRQLKPEQLPRRPGQKKIEVPDDIEPIFGTKAAKKGLLRIAIEKPKAPAPAIAPGAATSESQPVAAPGAPAVSAAAVPPPPKAPEATSASVPLRAPNLDPSLATLRPAAATPTPSAPAHHDQVVAINLMDVTSYWAARGKTKLEKLYHHCVDVPVTAIEAGLKRGKVEFPWHEVRCWIRLNPGAALPTIENDTLVDFPLSLVAPRFFELQEKTAPRKKVEVSGEIPDVFVRHAPTAPGVPVAPAATPAHAPASLLPAPTAVAPQELVPAGDDPREFGEIFGQPDKKDWSLGEVSQRTSSLPGVAGAIIATSDGLLVGGEWPGAASETVAAFAPQMYNRMTSYTKELHLGEPNHFTLLIENVPLQIFKSADSYFTVLGRAGENLPAKELNAIATRLAETLTATSN